MTKRRLHPLLFAMPRMAGTFSHTALFVLTLPLLLLQTVGPEHKGFHLAFVNCSASFVSLFLLWLAGSYVDRRPDGSRNRWLVSCTLFFALVPLAILSFVQGYAVLSFALIAVFLARVITDAGLLVTLTDDEMLRPRESYTASLIVMHFLGSVLGAIAFGLVPLSVPIGESFHFLPAAGAAFTLTGIALLCFLQATKKSSQTVKFKPPPEVGLALTLSFKYFLIARSCFLAGILVVPLFLVFMVGDLMMAENIRHTSAKLMACLLVGGLFSSSVSGHLVRKIGETSLLLRVGLVLALIAPVFLVTLSRSDLLAMVCMVVFGAGFGVIMVAGTSLSIKLAANTGMSGRYMALLTMSTFLSQFLASASGGMVLDPLNRLGDNLGYWGLLVVVEIFLFCGGWALQGVKS